MKTGVIPNAKRSGILILLLLCLGCPGVKPPAPAPTPPASEPPNPNLTRPFVYVEAGRFMLRGEEFRFKGVNYFPVKKNWRNHWLDWNPKAIWKEISLLKTLGVNVVRIFVSRDDFTGNNGFFKKEMVKRFEEHLKILDSAGMKAIVTLFMWHGYSEGCYVGDREHAARWAIRYGQDTRIFAWDISNELDHRWAKGIRDFAYLRRWAEGIASVVRQRASQLILCGEYGHFLGDRGDWQGSGINPDLSRLTLPVEKTDVICFHWYGHDRALGVALGKIRKLTNKPILVEEVGLPTGGVKNGQRWPLNEENVAGYQRAWQREALRYGAYLMPWCGFDYDPATTTHFRPDDTELFFGLFDKDYRLKANGHLFRDYLYIYDTDSRTSPIKHYERSEEWLKQ